MEIQWLHDRDPFIVAQNSQGIQMTDLDVCKVIYMSDTYGQFHSSLSNCIIRKN
jgi:hypothetical protein